MQKDNDGRDLAAADVRERLRSKLAFYNTASRTAERFSPLHDGVVRLYACGPTVYSSPHIGNMRTYIFADVLRRTLRTAGYQLDDAMNITDVGHLVSDADSGDDKMAKAAAAERLSAWQVARKYTEVFFEDAEKLNITPTKYVLRATDHIPEQIELIGQLDAKGVLYRTDDGMYFDTSKVADYGKLTPNDSREHLRAGERVAMGDKRNPTDFAVWKFSPADGSRRDMEWPSPWGVGFPGWHIECSAMAIEYLGQTLDIHVGGIDHIPVHHTNEIAQSETATGRTFARYWMHGAFLVPQGKKRMGKSEGNKITLAELAALGYTPAEFRYFVLLTHYRHPLSFTIEALDAAATAYRRLRQRMDALREEIAGAAIDADWQQSPYLVECVEVLADDLNVPKTVATLWNLLRDGDTPASTKLAICGLLDEVLGLDLDVPVERTVPAEVAELAQRRWQLRSERQFAESDRLRDELLALGYEVKDERDGYQVVPVRATP